MFRLMLKARLHLKAGLNLLKIGPRTNAENALVPEYAEVYA